MNLLFSETFANKQKIRIYVDVTNWTVIEMTTY